MIKRIVNPFKHTYHPQGGIAHGHMVYNETNSKETFKTERLGKNKKYDALIHCVKLLNREIAADESLGEGFRIGHSYFCTKASIDDMWLNNVVKYELIPLLKEYWFDDKAKVDIWSQN